MYNINLRLGANREPCMNTDVVLINPSYIYPSADTRPGQNPGDGIYSDALVMDLPSMEFLYPPVGLLSLAGALKRDGFAVEGIDSNTRKDSMEELARQCEGAKVVGITLLVANLRSVYQLVKYMKGRGYEVVVGGAYPSITPEVVAQLGLRYGISGEGEVAFTRLCRALIRGEGKPEDIPGIIINDEGELYTKPPVLLENLNDWLPDRDIMRSENYKLPFAGGLEVALASRGCPYSCTFCYCSSAPKGSMFTTSRWVDVDVMVGDIKATINKYNPNYIEMIDETFTVSRKFVLEFCQAIKDEGLKFKWGAKTRMDLVDEDILAAMQEAGCKKIGFGLESGVYDHRLAMRKDFSNDHAAWVFDTTRKLGLESGCTVIFGHPNETKAEMQQSVDFVIDSSPDYVEFHVMVLIPKTKLFYDAVAEGKATPDIFERFMRGEITYPEYAPGDITAKEMRAIHKSAIRQFYFRPGYVAQAVRRVRSADDLLQYGKTALSLLKMSDIKRPSWMLGRT
jgi:anaerobic magnesium-protoporphyrin IX monomethyl ester cyclase